MRHLFPAVALAALLACFAEAHPGAHVVIDHFTAEIEKRPLDQALRIQRGIAYSNDGQFDEALADFLRAEQLGDPIAVAFDLGVLHYRKGDFPASRRYFDLYLEKFPGHAPTLEYRARLRRDADDAAGAIADYRAYFAKVGRPHPGDYSAAATLLATMPTEGAEPALALLDEGMTRLGLIPQLQQQAIAIELQRGRTDRALARQRTLEPILGESPDWKVEMGELLMQAGNKAEAERQFRLAIEQLETLRPTPARRTLLGKAQAHLGEARASE
jgi:tetratricopeptide (TPR) repeat protein